MDANGQVLGPEPTPDPLAMLRGETGIPRMLRLERTLQGIDELIDQLMDSWGRTSAQARNSGAVGERLATETA